MIPPVFVYRPTARKQTFSVKKLELGQKRTGLDAFQADIFADKVKAVIIWKPDQVGPDNDQGRN